MSKVVHFEIPYDDADRANHFYEHVFGWGIHDMKMPDMEYFGAHTGPVDDDNMPTESGFINGGLLPKNEFVKTPVIAIMVDDLEATLRSVEGHGGSILMDPVRIGNMGLYAYATDSEGNVIGVWQNLMEV